VGSCIRGFLKDVSHREVSHRATDHYKLAVRVGNARKAGGRIRKETKGPVGPIRGTDKAVPVCCVQAPRYELTVAEYDLKRIWAGPRMRCPVRFVSGSHNVTDAGRHVLPISIRNSGESR